MGYLDPAAGKRREKYIPATVANLTNTFGTANGAMEDVTATFSQAALNNNFRECSDKINAILVELRKAGIIT